MDNVKAFSHESVFFQLFLFVIFIALTLFCLDQSLERMDNNAILSMNCFVTQALFNTLFSYFSDKVSSRSMEIGWFVYRIHWYELPPKQRLFIEWIIRRAQKPFIITGAKIIPSSMETIAKVLVRLLKLLSLLSNWDYFVKISANAVSLFMLRSFPPI